MTLFCTQLRPNWVCYYYRTLTAPVELIKCFKSIKEHAFVASEYPVVITLEDHLTPNLQAKVAEVGYFVIIFCSFIIPSCSDYICTVVLSISR